MNNEKPQTRLVARLAAMVVGGSFFNFWFF
jgi:hypothetical protein